MLEVALMAAAAGVASVPHCAGMCGPLCAAACSGRRAGALGAYQGGRLLAYGALGAVAGHAGSWASTTVPARWGSAALSWTLALGLLFAAARLLRGEARPRGLVRLDRGRDEADGRRGPRIAPAVLGLATGALPCGALYAALLLAAGSGTMTAGALGMIVFGVTSGAGLVGVGLLARRLQALATPTARRLLGATLVLGALVMALRPLPSLLTGSPACHEETAASPAASAVTLGGDAS